jgi:glycosyltransferase involved in cell wall biosynthesis
MGVWALTQAQALARQNIELRVVSFSSWMPQFIGRFSAGARAYSHCPTVAQWDDLTVEYPRWLLCPVGPPKKWAYRRPEPQMRFAARSAWPFLQKLVTEWHPDLVFAHHTMANGYLAEQINQRFGIPFVTLDHDFGEVSDCERFAARRATFGRIATRAARVLAVSRRMESSLKRLFPTAHTSTQHNGVDAIPLEILNAPRPPEIQGKTVILGAGMFYERKGFPLLVEAFASVAERFPNAQLRLAGDGETSAAVDAAIARYNLGTRVERLGLIPHAQLLQEMAWADVFASVGWDEPFATVFLEAAAADCALVWATDGGISDVLKDGVHGIGVAPRDVQSAARALEKLLAHPHECSAMSKRASELFRSQLHADAVATSLVALFHRVVDKNKT